MLKRFIFVLLVGCQSFWGVSTNELGFECTRNEDCKDGISGDLSICGNTGTCSCNDHSVPNNQFTKCFEKVSTIDDPCEINEQCSRGPLGSQSYCDILNGQVCRCNSLTSIPNAARNKCLKANVPIRQFCEETDQCFGYPNSVCSTSKRCGCMENFVSNIRLDDCLPIINELGKPCKESLQCSFGIPGALSRCFENECRCLDYATSGPNEHVCRAKVINVGDSCEITAQCTINLGHSYCQGGNCVCLSEAVESANRMKCLLKAYLGENCEEDNQCSHVGHSVCLGNSKTCQCESGYISDPSGSTCVLENEITLKIGQPCTDISICPGSSRCSASGYCSCWTGYVQSRDLDDCLLIRNSLGDICEEHQQCQLGRPGLYSSCVNNKCNCMSNAISVLEGNTCYRKATMVRDQCLIQDQCTANLGPSICIEGECQCFEEYRQSADKTKCI